MQTKSLELQMQGYRLTTAEIIYHLPDYPRLLQSYIWQELDLAPQYPILKKFLDFWEDNLDGRLHSVKLASREIVRPSEFRLANVELTMH
ncbi:Usg family protein [Alphaproteobacteria bacterium HT1-32]|nr:Usg family protein [Alphaproteobacteria bacterium HT1-32]